jgi:hypothetical protein
VLALALALWRAARRSPTIINPSVLARSFQPGPRYGDVPGGVGYAEGERYQAQRGASGVLYESFPYSRRGRW